MKKLYIGKREMEEEDLMNFLETRALPVPDGQLCEQGNCGPEMDPATTYLYHIKDGHVCWEWVCEDCMESASDENYMADHEWPQTNDGYAVAPKHCA